MSDEQIFLTSLLTSSIGRGPGATVATSVPDKHHFRGSYGAKDVVPLYRDAQGTPNADPRLLEALGVGLGHAGGVKVEDLFAYVYAVLAGTDYSERFSEELQTPGPRIPLTADADLFVEGVNLGQELLWLQTYGQRFAEGRHGLLAPRITVDGPLVLVDKPSDIKYDPNTQVLRIGSGKVTGVTREVWNFEVQRDAGREEVAELQNRQGRGSGHE